MEAAGFASWSRPFKTRRSPPRIINAAGREAIGFEAIMKKVADGFGELSENSKARTSRVIARDCLVWAALFVHTTSFVRRKEIFRRGQTKGTNSSCGALSGLMFPFNETQGGARGSLALGWLASRPLALSGADTSILGKIGTEVFSFRRFTGCSSSNVLLNLQKIAVFGALCRFDRKIIVFGCFEKIIEFDTTVLRARFDLSPHEVPSVFIKGPGAVKIVRRHPLCRIRL
jgi:hypothetical protein